MVKNFVLNLEFQTAVLALVVFMQVIQSFFIPGSTKTVKINLKHTNLNALLFISLNKWHQFLNMDCVSYKIFFWALFVPLSVPLYMGRLLYQLNYRAPLGVLFFH